MLPLLRRLLLAGLLLGLAAAPAAASGTALGVDQDARRERGPEILTLQVGSDIFIGDRVVTDARGLVQIRFADRTRLVVGPRSALVIEDYLLRPDGTGGRLAVDALAGTFRFVSGGAPKDRYAIKTPTGTIGVRGTGFDFNVTPQSTEVLLYEGALQLCSPSGACVVLDDPCELGEANLSEARLVGFTTQITGAARDALRSAFRYAVSEANLLGPFRIAAARACLNRQVVLPEQNHVSSTTPSQDYRNYDNDDDYYTGP